MPRPEQLLVRARSAASAGRHAQAARYLDLAAEGDPAEDLVARVEVTRAYVLCETGHLPEAVEVCLRVLARPGLEETVRGKAWQQLGLIRMRSGDADVALDAFAHAIAALPADELDQGLVLLNRGNVHLQQGRAREAAQDFEGARRILGAVGDPVESAKAEHNLGYTRLLRGELIEALRAMESAAVVLAPLSPVSRAVGEQDRAEVLLAAGRPREAIRALESAAAAYGARRLRTFQAECELALAWTTLREDPARARVIARRAARRFRTQASPMRALRADAAALVAEISSGVRTPSVLARADALRDELRASACAPCVSTAPPRSRRGCCGARCARSWPSRAATGTGPASTCAPGWPTCTAGSPPLAASTCRARWSVTAATWPTPGSGSPSSRATRPSCSSGPSVRARWSVASRPCGRRRTRRRPPT